MSDWEALLRLDHEACATLDRLLRDEVYRHDGDHDPKAQEKYRAALRVRDDLSKARKQAWEAL